MKLLNKSKQRLKYLFSDTLMSMLSWTAFFLFRKLYIEPLRFGYAVDLEFTKSFYLGLIILPFFWIILYYLKGYYADVAHKSRLQELGDTLLITFIGTIIIFFGIMLDDFISNYKNYYALFFFFFSAQFLLTYFPRLFITSLLIKKIRKRKIGFPTLLVGSNGKAMNIYTELEKQPKSSGNYFIGFVSVIDNPCENLQNNLSYLGQLNDIADIIDKHDIEEVIVAIENNENTKIGEILNATAQRNLILKIIPEMYDLLTGRVKMSTIYGEPVIEITRELLPVWQEKFKRIFDIVISILALILFLPLYLILAIGVRMSSKGPIFYSHERIGIYGKPFNIYKFRSMYTGAEQNGPALSSKEDSRITPFGRFMRKSRLDELPQFYNVLIGDMSLVGPRPERKFFIDQIVKRAPHYNHLQKVRPGITSWGQVKFGYAENIDEMIIRLKYDLVYLENMSLYTDFKILIYTILIVFKGSGK